MILGIKPQQKAAYQQLIRAICQRVGQPFILQIGCEQGNSWFDAARFAEAVDWAHQAAKAVDPEIVVWAGGFNAGVYFGLTAAQQAELRAAPGIGPAMQHKLQFYQAFLEQRPAMDALSLHLNRDLAYVRPTVSWFREQLDARGLTGAAIAVEDMLSGPWFHPCSIPNPLGCQDDALQQLAAGDPAFVEQYRRDQARGLVQKTSAALALGVRRVLVSTDVDWSGYHMEIWNHQGLVDGAGARKYAFFAFERLAGYLGRFRSAEPLRYDDDGVYLLAFTLADGRRLWLAWKDAASAAAQLTVSGVEGATVEAVPALPRFSAPVTFDPSETLPVEEGRVTIDLGTEPMYYVEAG